MIPLVHDFEGETVLVFGGGPVGARKARRFAREAQVVVVSPSFDDTAFGDSELVRAVPDPEDVPGWFDRTDPALAVAATDDEEINDAVVQAARDRGTLVNRADRSGDRDPGSVVVPATVRDDPVVVSISTGGRSPALSRTLRERIEAEIEGAGEIARVTGELRTELKEAGIPATDRRDAIRTAVSHPELWRAIDDERADPRAVAREIVGGDRRR